VDAGQSMDFNGDLMGTASTVPGSDPEEPRNALADDDWTKFRARVDREWRQRRGTGPHSADGGDAARPAAGYDSAGYRVTDFGDQLLSGPASQLFGGRSSDSGSTGSEYGRIPAGTSDPQSYPSHPSLPPAPAVPPPQPAETSGLVRPYFRTGGRTRPTYDLAIEALVSTSERGRVLNRVKVPEHRSICGLCLDTRSVAEVAAYLRLPLGVVRVLIGDVAGLGLVLVHTATAAVGDRPSIDFMERVLSGLRRI
jgi:uncharacterized protein DUF742